MNKARTVALAREEGGAAALAGQRLVETNAEQEARHRAALARAREADQADALYADPRPRDLACRISEMGERWLRIWLSLGQYDLDGDNVLRVCLELIREAHWSARGVVGARPVAEIVRTIRHGATVAVDLRREMYLRLADELDAIVRDDAEQS